MQHRPAIDGLRAVAVLPVIAFHAFPAWLPGGFIGVDIFFVISGYLIAGLLLDEIDQTSKINLARFYERRARRILPALIVVMAVTAIAGVLLLLPSALRDLGRQVAYSSLFVSNLLGVSQGYFDQANELRPLFHTWSLSVEEQFYVVFPLVLLLVAPRLARRQLLLLLVIACVGLLAASILSGTTDRSFYSSAARGWELLAGAICAAMARPVERPWLGVVGLTAVVASFFLFDGSTPWPSFFALLPVSGVALILLHGTERGAVAGLLSLAPFVFIGLISYSAYLIHQPLFAFARVLGASTPAMLAALSLATLALGWLSYRFVETPWRRRRAPTAPARYRLLAGSLVVLICFAAVGAAFDWSKGLIGRFPPAVAQILEAQNEGKFECLGAASIGGRGCIYGPVNNARVAILGDSHAEALALGLSDGLKDLGIGLVAMGRGGCAPLSGLDRIEARGGVRGCADDFSMYLDELASRPDIDIVVLACRWTMWVNMTSFDNGEGGVEPTSQQFVPTINGKEYAPRSPEFLAGMKEGLAATVRQINGLGKQVILVGQVPETGWDVPEQLARSVIAGTPAEQITTSYPIVADRLRITNDLIAAAGAPAVFPASIFCDTSVKGRCLNELGGAPLYRDDDHLSIVGAKMLSARLLAEFNKNAWL